MELFGFKNIFDVDVFDQSGTFAFSLNTSTDTNVKYFQDEDGSIGYLGVTNPVLNFDYLKFIADKDDDRSDYEKKASANNSVIEIGGLAHKSCKLICTGAMRSSVDDEDYQYTIEIPTAKIVNRFDLNLNDFEPAEFDILFKIKPYNSNNSLFKIHI